MSDTWYVTIERGTKMPGRPARVTETFKTESQAKDFARENLIEGFTVFAGTINPHAPKRSISPGNLASWLGN